MNRLNNDCWYSIFEFLYWDEILDIHNCNKQIGKIVKNSKIWDYMKRKSMPNIKSNFSFNIFYNIYLNRKYNICILCNKRVYKNYTITLNQCTSNLCNNNTRDENNHYFVYHTKCIKKNSIKYNKTNLINTKCPLCSNSIYGSSGKYYI